MPVQRILSVFFAFLLLGGLTLPATAATSAGSIAKQRAVAPSDSQIEATLRMKLAKSKIGKDGFRFHVQRGVVTWEGTTNIVQHKGSATRMARAAGAVQVVNNIQVSATGKAKATASLKRASVQQ